MSTKPKVYLETTIIGYLAAEPSREVIVAGNQLLTHQWWQERRKDFDLYVSELVELELGAGNPTLASQRLQWIADLPYLEITSVISRLAQRFVQDGPLPQKAARDAIHIANAFMERKLHAILKDEGFSDPPVICTPQELLSTNLENSP